MDYLYRLTNPDPKLRVPYIEDKYAKLEATPIPWCAEHQSPMRIHQVSGDYCLVWLAQNNPKVECRLEEQAVYRIKEIS